MTKNIGRFRFSGELLRDQHFMLAAMRGIAPVRISSDAFTDTVEYTAYCIQFSEVLEGQEIPLYDAKVVDGSLFFERA